MEGEEKMKKAVQDRFPTPFPSKKDSSYSLSSYPHGNRPTFPRKYEARRSVATSGSNEENSVQEEFPQLPKQSHTQIQTPSNTFWSNRAFEDNRSSMKLELMSVQVNSEGKLIMPDDIADEGVKKWKNSLVGYFLGKKPPFQFVKKAVMSLWGKKGLQQVLATDGGFFYLQFSCKEDSIRVLEDGPWMIGGKALMLKKWQPMMNNSKDIHEAAPIWVKVYNYPVEMWGDKGHSYVASFLGTPLHVDKLTETQERITFARICVEMKATSSFPNSVVIQHKGKDVELQFEYQSLPIKCSKCSVFGHRCDLKKPEEPKKKEQEWRDVKKNKGKEKVDEYSDNIIDNLEAVTVPIPSPEVGQPSRFAALDEEDNESISSDEKEDIQVEEGVVEDSMPTTIESDATKSPSQNTSSESVPSTQSRGLEDISPAVFCTQPGAKEQGIQEEDDEMWTPPPPHLLHSMSGKQRKKEAKKQYQQSRESPKSKGRKNGASSKRQG